MVTEADWIDVLDVSAAQGKIDFARVAAAQVAPGVDRRFRAAICKISEGTAFDQSRVANLALARAAGLLVGAYLFFRIGVDAEAQAEAAWQAVGDTMPSLPIAIDLESAPANFTPQRIIDELREIRDAVVARFGRAPILYGYPDFTTRRMQPALAQALDIAALWYWGAFYGSGRPYYPTAAQIPKPPAPFATMALWQYSGNTVKTAGQWTGAVDGIVGDVDRSVYLLGEESFRFDFCGEPRPDQLEPEAAIVHPMVDLARPEPSDDG